MFSKAGINIKIKSCSFAQFANWVHNLRKKRLSMLKKDEGEAPKKEEKHLTTERIARLDSIGFVWKINFTPWEQRYQELIEVSVRLVFIGFSFMTSCYIITICHLYQSMIIH